MASKNQGQGGMKEATKKTLEAASMKLAAYRTAIAEIRGSLSEFGVADEALAKVIRYLNEADTEIDFALEEEV